MFPVPEPVLKGNKFLATIFPRKTVKEWVISWMQKLHPCFDGRFLSDIKFYKEKGKIMALVTVAEKLKVASHLEKRNTAVYVYRPEKRRVFAGNVSGRRFWLASAFAAALVMATLSGFALRSDSRIAGVPDVLADVPERDAQKVMRALDGSKYKGRRVRCNDAEEGRATEKTKRRKEEPINACHSIQS